MKDVNLPLFLHVTDPLAIIVVNDDLIVRQRSAGGVLYPYRSLELLFQLYSDPFGKTVVPKRFHTHLDNKELQSKVRKSNCLVGLDEELEPDVLYLCFNFDMTITQNKNPYAHLKNFSYNKKPLNYELEISASDIFQILANICVEQQLPNILSKIDLFEKSIFKTDFITNSDVSTNTRFFKFVWEYIAFMQEKIIAGTMNLLDVLKLSGIPLFEVLYVMPNVHSFINNSIGQLIKSYDELSRNEKIIFYALARCIQFHPLVDFSNVNRLFQKNRNLLRKILSELWPQFPALLSDWLE